jgi:hypothetical protein
MAPITREGNFPDAPVGFSPYQELLHAWTAFVGDWAKPCQTSSLSHLKFWRGAVSTLCCGTASPTARVTIGSMPSSSTSSAISRG